MTYEFSKARLINDLVKNAKFSIESAARMANLPCAPHVALMNRIRDFDTSPNRLTQNVGRGKYQLGRMVGKKFVAITEPASLDAHMESMKEIAREVGAL